MICPGESSARNPSNNHLSTIPSFFRKLKNNEHVIMALLAVAVGLAAGFGALGFRLLIELFQSIAYPGKGNVLEIAMETPWYMKFWVPALGGVAVGCLTYFYAKDAQGIGIPEVMEAVALRKGVIKKKFLFLEPLLSAVSIGTGGSAGVIAPTVFIGSAIGSATGQILKISADRTRALVGCGAAAGIAAIFNAPIGGCMFALEVILGDFGLASFSPIVISSVVATAVSRHFVGDYPAILVPPYELESSWAS
jgi:CIC family chloride channel protein